MNWPSVFSRSVPIILLAGALLLLGLVFASFHFATEADGDSRKALDASRLNNRVLQVLSLLQDAESSQRGFIITGSPRYLTSFKRADVLSGLQLSSVKTDLEYIGVPPITVERLRTLVDTKLRELRQTVELKASGKSVEAVDIVKSDVGLLAMDEIKQIMMRIDAITSNIGFQQANALKAATWMLLVSIVVGAVVLIALVGGAVALVFVRSRQLENARNALASHNETLEQKVLDRTQFLERANRELQSYSYIVGHDLRAPLVNIMGFTSELERATATFLDYLDAPSAARRDMVRKDMEEAVRVDIPEALGFIRSSMKRMDGLINEILKFARAGNRQLHAEPIDLSDLLGETVATLKHRLDETGAVIIVSPDLPALRSDRLALQQIFGNLLDNAIKYADPTRMSVVEISGTISGDTAAIMVRDNGRGIAEHDLERVFELFRRSGRQDRPGEGIGLAHVRALVRRLGGDVGVHSVLGEGTTFTVTMAVDIGRARSGWEQ